MTHHEMTKTELLDEIAALRAHVARLEAQQAVPDQIASSRDGSAELYRITLENISDAVFITDDQGQFTFVCPNTLINLGYTVDEIWQLGKITHLLGEGLFDPVALMEAGELCDLEWKVNAKNGQEHILLINVKHASIQGGTILYVCRDITAHKQTEITLHALINAVQESLFLMDVDGTIRVANAELGRRFGQVVQDLPGMNAYDLVSPEIAKHRQRFTAQVIANGGVITTEDHRLDRIIESHLYPVMNNQGDVTQIAVFGQDITERRQAEIALQESEARLRSLMQLAPIGIYLTDENGDCQYVNDRWLEMAGMIFEDALGDGWKQGLHPDDRDKIVSAWYRMVKSRGHWGLEYRFQTPAGKVTWVYGLATPFYSNDGEIGGYIGVNLDITERKDVENQIQLNEDRLKTLLGLSQLRGLSQQEFIEFALEEMVRLTHSEVGYLHFVDSEQQTIQLYAWSKKVHVLCDVVDSDSHYALNDAGIWVDCVRLGRPAIHNDYQSLPDKKGYPLGHFHVTRHMSVPVFEDNKIVTIVGVGNRVEPYTVSEARQLSLFATTAWDILQRRQTEIALRESQERYQILFDSMLDGYALHEIICDDEGIPIDYRFLDINPSFEHMTGLSRDIIGKRVLEVLPGTESYWIETYGKVTLTGEPIRFQNYSEEVGQKWFEVVAFRTQENHFATIFQEITERKRAEHDLRASEERYRLLAANVKDMISRHSLEGVYLDVTLSCRTLLGYEPAELIGLNAYEFFHPDDLQAVRASHDIIVNEDRAYIVEYRIRHKAGHYVWLETASHVVKSESGAFILAVTRDIAERRRAEAALRESEARFRHLYESVHAGVIVQAADGTITHVNDVASVIFEMDPTDVLASTSLDPKWQMITEDGTPVAGESHPSMITIRTGQPVRNAVRGLFAGDPDRLRWLLINTEPVVHSETGELQEVIITFSDITAQKQIEKQLRDERDFSDSLIQTAQVIVLVLDTAGRIVRFNEYMEELAGYALDDVKGRDWVATFLPAHKQDQARVLFQQAISDVPTKGSIDPIVTRQGVELEIEWYDKTLKDSDGEIIGLLAIGLDVTERKQIEEAEREQRSFATALVDTAEAINSTLQFDEVLDRILDSLSDVVPHDGANIMLLDDDATTVCVARYCACYARRGLPNPKLDIPRPVARLPHIQTMIETGRPLVIVDTLAYPGWIESTSQPPIRSYVGMPIQIEGHITGLLNLDSTIPGFFTDQHAERLKAFAQHAAIAIQNARMYQRLASYNEDLEAAVKQRTAELSDAYQELQVLSRAKDEFVANVSHELRSPLTTLALRHHLLRRKPEHFTQHLEVLERETARLNQTIEDLLRLSRLDQGRTEIVFGTVDLNAVVGNLIYDRELQAQQKGLTLEFSGQAGLPSILADQGLLEQVISILLTNAMNYTPTGGEIVVSTQTRHAQGILWIGCRVQDTGLGIPPDEQVQLFERFFQGQANRLSGTPGTGLGLAIAKEIIDCHHGEIEVESTGIPGEGTAFTVWLPAEGETNV